MESIWIIYTAAALMGGLASVVAQAGTKEPSRFADLIAAIVAGCFFGTFALFLGPRVLIAEALFCVAWIAWAQTRGRHVRTRGPE